MIDCGSELARNARSVGLFFQVFRALQRLVSEQQVLVMADQFFFEQTPCVVILGAEQFDKAPAFDLVAQLTDVTALFRILDSEG